MDKVTAPFTLEQVQSLNGFQHASGVHPFTCGNDQCRGILVATVRGWICPFCDYTQDWAHAFMADNSWEKSAEVMRKGELNSRFSRAAATIGKLVISDEELALAIEVYEQLEAFFHSRTDAGIVLSALRAELTTLSGFKYARDRR